MKLIPEVKQKVSGERIEIKGYEFILPVNCDERIVKAASKAPVGETEVAIFLDDKDSAGYKIVFGEKIRVWAQGVKGAFYAIQTLRQIAKNGYTDAKEIVDSPDFEVRGFYYDITRGRIPTLESLKKLVDTLSYYKINMLQLYV